MSRDRPADTMLERGVQILQAFRPSGGTLTLPQIVERTGLPKATAHRLVSALVGADLLERQSPGYRPGVGLFELGELVDTKLELRELALPFMQDLYEATHQTIHLGVRDGLDVIYAEKIRGHRGVSVPSRVGRRLPLSSTGVGKALLAHAPDDVVEAVLSRPLRALTPVSITDPARLRRQLRRIKADGYALESEEAMTGVQCVAVPVLVAGQAVAALSIAAPTSADVTQYPTALLAVASALARRLRQRSS